jgi:hypothetical protein
MSYEPATAVRHDCTACSAERGEKNASNEIAEQRYKAIHVQSTHRGNTIRMGNVINGRTAADSIVGIHGVQLGPALATLPWELLEAVVEEPGVWEIGSACRLTVRGAQ